jgi:hypothetical protein
MAGMGLPADPVHLDLLYTSRRMWRGLFPDYSLSTVEERALGIRRCEDVPGWQIPEIYNDFIRGRSLCNDMLEVLEHNRNDVVSLAALLLKQLDIVGAAALQQSPGDDPINPVTLSELLMNGDRREDARSILTAHLDNREALKSLALLCKREHQFVKALEHFEELRTRSNDIDDFILACTEAAKIYEHRLKDFDAALRCTERMFRRIQRSAHFRGRSPRHDPAMEEIVKRMNRLKRRLELQHRHG